MLGASFTNSEQKTDPQYASLVAIGGKGGFMDMTHAAFAMVHYPTEAFMATDPPEGSSIVNISSVVGPIQGGGAFEAGMVNTTALLTSHPFHRWSMVLGGKGGHRWVSSEPSSLASELG